MRRAHSYLPMWATSLGFATLLIVFVMATSCTTQKSRSESTVLDVGVEAEQKPAWREPTDHDLLIADYSDGSGSAQLLLLDSQTGTVGGAISVGLSPDFALLPDGQSLLVSSYNELADEHLLQIFDAGSGEEAERMPNPYMAHFGRPTPLSWISVAAGGAEAYFVRLYLGPGTSVPGDTRLAVFDTTDREFAEREVDLSDCFTPVVFPVAPSEVAMLCAEVNSLAFASTPGVGGEGVESILELPIESQEVADANGNPVDLSLWSAAIGHPQQPIAFVVSRLGRLWVVDLSARSIVDEVNLPMRDSEWVPPSLIGMSSDGEYLYIGVGELSDRLDLAGTTAAHSILVVEARTLATTLRLESSRPFDGIGGQSSSEEIILYNTATTHIEFLPENPWDGSRVFTRVGIAPARITTLFSR